MKSNLLRTFFEWALITSLLMSVGFFAWYVVESRGVRACDSQMAVAQVGLRNVRTVMGVLQIECKEYAKTNGDMQRLLPTLGAHPAAAPAATSKPASK